MAIEKVLIVEDEVLMRSFITEALKRLKIDSTAVETGENAVDLIKEESFDLVITDLKMPGISGLDVLRKVKEISPQTLVMVITAFGTIETAVEAMKAGAFDYLLKPFTAESLAANIEKAQQYHALVNENLYLREEVRGRKGSQTKIVAESQVMKQILIDIEKAAKSSASIFIQGETGTGKEVIAQFIHDHSLRSKSPFIKVNCAAIPETLVESEFFGHEKGAFTGAASKRMGRFEIADKGSLLLDEITEVPQLLQPKLLRAIQEQEFERVGGTKPIRVDVRLISTTNRNIQQALTDKVIRDDLYYRLNVIPILLPPLRERKEDIIPLAEYFIDQACLENHFEKRILSEEAKSALLKYQWPGNIRELENIIERAVVLGSEKTIKPSQLGL